MSRLSDLAAQDATTASTAFIAAEKIIPSIREWVEAAFVRPTLQNIFDALRRGEEDVEAGRRSLQELAAAGMAEPTDYVAFDKLRASLYRAQLEVYAVVCVLVQQVNPALVLQIPQPQLLPAVERRPSLGEPVTATTFVIVIVSL